MVQFLYFIIVYIFEFFLTFFFLTFFLDLSIYLLTCPLMDDNEKKKLKLNYFFFKLIEDRKKKVGFTNWYDFYFSVKFIKINIKNLIIQKKLFLFLLNFNKFLYILFSNFFIFFNFDFLFILSSYQIKKDTLKKVIATSIPFYIFIFLSFFSFLKCRGLKYNFYKIFEDIVIEFTLIFIFIFKFFIFPFFNFRLSLGFFASIQGNNLLSLSRNYLFFILQSVINFILSIPFLDKIFSFFFSKFYWYFLHHLIQFFFFFIRNHYILGSFFIILFIVFFFIFYFFIYVFFCIFSFFFLILSFLFSIFLWTLNLDFIIFFQFKFKDFFIKLKLNIKVYKKLTILFCHKYYDFFFGDYFFKELFCIRKCIYLCIYFTGYFFYFLIGSLIFFFLVIFFLIFFSFLRPILIVLLKTLIPYSKRAEFILWNEELKSFFLYITNDIELTNNLISFFSLDALIKIIKFWLIYYIDGLESFCSKPLTYYIFADFLTIFKIIVIFFHENPYILWIAKQIFPSHFNDIHDLEFVLKLAFSFRLKKSFIDIFNYILSYRPFSVYAFRDFLVDAFMAPELAKEFRQEASVKDLKLIRENATDWEKFFVATFFFFEFLWNYKYIAFMMYYVFSIKLPILVFNLAYKLHNYLFKYVISIRFDYYKFKIKTYIEVFVKFQIKGRIIKILKKIIKFIFFLKKLYKKGLFLSRFKFIESKKIIKNVIKKFFLDIKIFKNWVIFFTKIFYFFYKIFFDYPFFFFLNFFLRYGRLFYKLIIFFFFFCCLFHLLTTPFFLNFSFLYYLFYGTELNFEKFVVGYEVNSINDNDGKILDYSKVTKFFWDLSFYDKIFYLFIHFNGFIFLDNLGILYVYFLLLSLYFSHFFIFKIFFFYFLLFLFFSFIKFFYLKFYKKLL